MIDLERLSIPKLQLPIYWYPLGIMRTMITHPLHCNNNIVYKGHEQIGKPFIFMGRIHYYKVKKWL